MRRKALGPLCLKFNVGYSKMKHSKTLILNAGKTRTQKTVTQNSRSPLKRSILTMSESLQDYQTKQTLQHEQKQQ
ncbi:hypothetical protein L596_029944 [Steinernema carpocapsae]|uniref:Uncharacterized protein n=1 Tax=Steinernema carpocapsae TaxID=34508 RepID=A0A4U5LR98_STECR|nr:hypothetical protein L596_029944 [Steinernema carpocapsae]